MTREHNTSLVGVQILAELLKAHHVRKIVAGTDTLNTFCGGIFQKDSYFEVFSTTDERSAGYIACGMAAESAEAVVLLCSGLMDFRSWMSPLTEAFYRQLPVLAVSSSPKLSDSTSLPRDCAKMTFSVPAIHTNEDAKACTFTINEALLELRHNGCGPVHLNIAAEYTSDFSIHEISGVMPVNRICVYDDVMPELKAERVGIFTGAYSKWSSKLTGLVDEFCEKYNGAVICSVAGNYKGKYAVNALSVKQHADLMIHIGQVSGAHASMKPREVWCVASDGAISRELDNLRYVFEMSEEEFFSRYVNNSSSHSGTEYYSSCRSEYERMLGVMPELPFSAAWIAQNTASRFPAGSVVRFGLKDSTAWDFFGASSGATAYSGIYGCVSSLLGASLASPDKVFFGVMDSPAFICNMNAIGSRHKGKNIRLMVINDGNVSTPLLKDYASDLGFEYLSAATKGDYLASLEHFMTPETLSRPLFFEVFTRTEADSEALSAIHSLGGEK